MRKFGVLLAVAVGVAFGTAALASGANVGGSAKRQSTSTFTIYSSIAAGRSALLPVTPGQFSLGARDVFSDDLFTSKGGKALGTDGGVCTLTRVANASTESGTLECEVTFSLPGGQIATQELNTATNGNFAGTQPGAITGGTGKYRGASGEISVKFLSSNAADITFILER